MSEMIDIPGVLQALPAELRRLVEAELAGGNQVVEVSRSHPAPLNGLCIRLACPVKCASRTGSATLSFFNRHSSSHSGEFSDPSRQFHVIEPPDPSDALEPNMDAIREAIDRAERIANADRFGPGSLW